MYFCSILDIIHSVLNLYFRDVPLVAQEYRIQSRNLILSNLNFVPQRNCEGGESIWSSGILGHIMRCRLNLKEKETRHFELRIAGLEKEKVTAAESLEVT